MEAVLHVRSILEGLCVCARYPQDSCNSNGGALGSAAEAAAARDEQSEVEDKRRVRTGGRGRRVLGWGCVGSLRRRVLRAGWGGEDERRMRAGGREGQAQGEDWGMGHA